VITTDEEAWVSAEVGDLWLFDKLILSRKLGYSCGPAGVPVPKPAEYIVRPISNLKGMGLGASIRYIQDTTDYLPAGYFWCELFRGRHISVDYESGVPVLAVEGFREPDVPLYRFLRWERVSDLYPIPLTLSVLRKFPYLNIEFIDSKVIEVHLRLNPDFKYGNSRAVPVWEDEEVPEGGQFVAAKDYLRKGFIID